MDITTTTLGEISIGKGQYGIGASAVDYSEKLYTYLRITDINDDGTLNDSDFKSVDDENASKYLLEPNDIVFARTGNSTGRNYFYDGSDGTFVYAGFLIRFKLDPKKVNPRYIKYYCLSDEYKVWVMGHSTGSTRGNINAQTYANMEIKLPPREQQDRLVEILDNLEKKRTINKSINKNLSEQIAALYQAWFVDFIPFHDNEFIETENGLIPKDWKYVSLGELCKTVSVTHKFNKKQLIFLNTGDIENGEFLHGNYSNVDEMPGQAKKSIKRDDILYSEIRPVNRHFAYVNFDAEDFVVSTKLMVIRATGISSRRLYQYLTSKPVIDELQLEAESRSGTFPQIRFENISLLSMLIATEEVEKSFAETISTIYSQIDCNIQENDRLTKLRDYLFPKLMSGELDVRALEI